MSSLKGNGEKEYLNGYEKIRSVGKGAYGTAFLYRKSSENNLVVIKEINMIESTAVGRQMALNEVQVLSVLNHPNIISYNGSFEKDGILMIEMKYADGGTLAEFLKNQSQPLVEQDILLMFQQVVSAIRYLHHHNILHRDLKTANVFLMTDQTVKVGDFGISKVMTSEDHAQTILGTPYYISPEMCEGKQYDQKSDIWALGCILHEMACLQKTFEGSNLLVLVNKITKGQFQIPTGYSTPFQKFLGDLLKKDPASRPTAAEIEDVILPQLINNSLGKKGDGVSDLEGSQYSMKNKKIQRSVLYKLNSFKYSTSLSPIPLPPKSQVTEIATSNTHCIALTADLVVYSWGDGSKGQLGHGDDISVKHTPEPVEALRGKNIKIIGAGEGFSVFVSETGMLMTCGHGGFGCLGHGNWNNTTAPRLVERLLSADIAAVGCGSHHVVVLSKLGIVYSWGRGQDGCLGQGNERDSTSPSVVSIPKHFSPKIIRCGTNNTMIISDDGRALGFGNNSGNKLGLDDRIIPFFINSRLEKILTPKEVTSISGRIADVALGPNHTIILTEDGYAITMGRNTEDQLGRRRKNLLFSHPVVENLAHRFVKMIQCGPTWSAAGTSDNTLYFWGTRFNSRAQNAGPSGLLQSEKNENLEPTFERDWGDRGGTLNDADKEVIPEPKEILALYASPLQIVKGEILKLAGIYAFQNDLLLLVDTSVPLIEKNQSQNYNFTASSEDKQEADSTGTIPNWIKSELAESVAPWPNS